MSRLKYSTRLGAAFVALLLVATACGSDTTAETTAAPPATTTPATTTTEATAEGCAVDGQLQETTFLMPFEFASLFFGAYIADLNGYFEEQGLNVTIETTGGSAAVVQQVMAGSVDFGMSDPGPIILAAALGQELKTVYTYSTHLVYGFVAPADTSLTGVADFVGKTIGVSEATAGEVPFLEAYLAQNGLDPATDVNIVESGPGGLTAVAFEEGRIDGYFTTFDGIIELGLAMDLKHYDLGEFDRLHGATTIAQSAFIDENPEIVRCLLRGVAKASEFAHASPAASLDITLQAFPDQEIGGGFDLLLVEKMVDVTRRNDEDSRWGWNRPASWSGWTDFMSSTGELTEEIDPTTLYTNEFIDYANDFDAAPIQQAAADATP